MDVALYAVNGINNSKDILISVLIKTGPNSSKFISVCCLSVTRQIQIQIQMMIQRLNEPPPCCSDLQRRKKLGWVRGWCTQLLAPVSWTRFLLSEIFATEESSCSVLGNQLAAPTSLPIVLDNKQDTLAEESKGTCISTFNIPITVDTFRRIACLLCSGWRTC